MKKILLTGSCGFIGTNFMRHVMTHYSNYNWVSVDKVIAKYNRPHVKLNNDHPFYMGDIADEQFINNVFALEKPDYVIHMAAESFVDDSIASAGPFIHSNVVGTQVMIDMSIRYDIKKFLYVSTDEVYGQLSKDSESWTEKSITKPRNPYSASKLSGELIVYAANQTHGLPFYITRSCNNYGKFQPPRNLVPKIVSCLIKNQEIPIHGTGENYREWIHALDHASGIMTVLENGNLNEIYNIGSGEELQNLEMVNLISKLMNKTPNIRHISDRKGHDYRYSINCDKLKSLGWKKQWTLEDGLRSLIDWYKNNDYLYK